MGHREIALIIGGCIVFISVLTILIKYFVSHKNSKNNKISETDTNKIEQQSIDKVDDSKKD